MKTAGKFTSDAELQSILKKTEGLGTEATRAGIITVLKDRKYIEVTKNLVYATKKGILLIDSIGKSILASPEMTAKVGKKGYRRLAKDKLPRHIYGASKKNCP